MSTESLDTPSRIDPCRTSESLLSDKKNAYCRLEPGTHAPLVFFGAVYSLCFGRLCWPGWNRALIVVTPETVADGIALASGYMVGIDFPYGCGDPLVATFLLVMIALSDPDVKFL